MEGLQLSIATEEGRSSCDAGAVGTATGDPPRCLVTHWAQGQHCVSLRISPRHLDDLHLAPYIL